MSDRFSRVVTLTFLDSRYLNLYTLLAVEIYINPNKEHFVGMASICVCVLLRRNFLDALLYKKVLVGLWFRDLFDLSYCRPCRLTI